MSTQTNPQVLVRSVINQVEVYAYEGRDFVKLSFDNGVVKTYKLGRLVTMLKEAGVTIFGYKFDIKLNFVKAVIEGASVDFNIVVHKAGDVVKYGDVEYKYTHDTDDVIIVNVQLAERGKTVCDRMEDLLLFG